MAEQFDPYRKWLGIPSQDQPPNHYQLLGIPALENDPDVIENAATAPSQSLGPTSSTAAQSAAQSTDQSADQ